MEKKITSTALSDKPSDEATFLTEFCLSLLEMFQSGSMSESVQKVGEIFQSMNQKNNFLSSLTKQFGKSFQEIEAMYAKGYQFYTQGEYEEAEKIFQILTTLSPMESKYFFSLGAAQQYNEQHERSIQSFWKSLLLNPKKITAYYHIGECEMQLNQKNSAKLALKTFIEKAKKKKEHRNLVQQASMMLSACKKKKKK